MINKEVIKYVKGCRKKRFSDNDIKKALTEAGWGQKEILEILFRCAPVKKLPKWVLIVSLVFAALIIAGFIWAAVFALNDIQKISDDIANMNQQVNKSNAP